MGKARDQIPPPVMMPPSDNTNLAFGQGLPGPSAREQLAAMASAQVQGIRPRRDTVAVEAIDEMAAKQMAPAITELAARAIGGSFGMAREYAAAAAEMCRSADTPQSRANVRKLLRLALAHLEVP